jgi:threonylcarbamoyladenosine tRNA methylthiotransferase MtaB
MYTLKGFTDIVDKVRSRYPDFNFTTDIIAGFPGETEEDLQQTIDVSKKIGFGHIHTFKYSVRKGTRAERMDEQIPEKEKTRRSEMVRLLAEAEKMKYRTRMLGKTQTVLVEKIIDGVAQGYGENYIPIKFPANSTSKNQFLKVRLLDVENSDEMWVHAEMI